MSFNSYNAIPTLKCAGKNCHNQGTIKLKIRFIRKVGFFCESCYLELKTLELIDGDVRDFGQRVGSSLNNKNGN